MAVVLSRDQALTIPLLSTHGTATLLSRDGHEVKVPLAPLLGASTLVRSMVVDSQLHPGIHGPLILSFAVATNVLLSVGDLLGLGKSNVREGNIEEVEQVLNSLGVVASLSQSRINNENEYVEYVEEEDIKQEMVFEPVSNEDADLSEDDVNEAKDNYSCSTPSNLKRHSRINTRDESYQCTICNYSCSSPGDLERHNRNHTGVRVKPYTCTVCNSSFSKPSHLRRHQRIHTGEKPFTCEICNSSFSQNSHLRTHVRIHTGEKPFTCKICNSSFSQPSHLRRHIRIHTGEKPFTCKICSSSFLQSSDLREHVRIHTGEKLICEICNSSFYHPISLRRHEKIHTGEQK